VQLTDDQRSFARSLRKSQTDAENRIWYHLRSRRFLGLRFRRQHPIGQYFADFVCIELGLVIELDGGQHNSSEGRWKDQVRSDVLAAHGFQVLRFWDNEVFANTPGVLQAIDREARTLQKLELGLNDEVDR
jgi:very-short-patch-repair endonuclease